MQPQLATLTDDRFSGQGWLFERKLDGERCLAFRAGDRVRLVSRSQHQITATFPEIADALAERLPADCVLDGEIVALDHGQPRFERLQGRLGVTRPGPVLLRSIPVIYYLFDIVYLDGEDLRTRPLRERKQILRRLMRYRDPIRFTPHRLRDGEAYWQDACRRGWEGIIAKRADGRYRSGRNRDWLKFKCVTAQEFVIGGYTDPQGSRPGLGALLLGYYEPGGRLAYAGKVGTGFDQRTLRRLHEMLASLEQNRPAFDRGDLPGPRGVHWVAPRLVGQVAFAEWTSGGQLRHPRFQGLRDDKQPAEVVREIPARAQSARRSLGGTPESSPGAHAYSCSPFPLPGPSGSTRTADSSAEKPPRSGPTSRATSSGSARPVVPWSEATSRPAGRGGSQTRPDGSSG
ncbi:MAG: non-homologous end-joining DNA ligase [Streptosporangiaceae bacterium]